MTNKIIPIAAIVVIVVIVAAFALTQTNQNTTAASSNDSMNMDNGDMGANGNTSNSTGANETVLIQNGTFNPANLTVKPGTTVIWTVKDDSNTKYMVTSNESGSSEGESYLFMSDDLTNGQSFSYTFNRTGSYAYYDMDHMDDKKLTGVIIVQ